MKPRAVVIGYGFAGKSFHSYLIRITPTLELYGVASRDAEIRERIVREQNCRAFETLEEVIADPNVDLVVLATPSSVHAEQAIAAMNAGKNVVTDKVMCLSLDDCDRMIEAARKNNVLLSVFQNRRWDGDFLTLQQCIHDGTLGDVRWVEMAWQGFGAWGGWRGHAEMGGGRFWDLGAHLVDQMTLLFPQEIEAVYARIHRDYPHTQIDSEALVVIHFAGGATGICDLSGMTINAPGFSKPRFAAHGTRGNFVKHGLDPQENSMIAGDIDSATEDPTFYARFHDGTTERTIPTLPGRWRNFYENIADALTGKAESAVSLPSVRRAMSVLDGAKRSSETGTVITL